MDETYHGTATLKDGRVIEVDGTLMSCSNWADNVIRAEGDCQISVIRIDDAGRADQCRPM